MSDRELLEDAAKAAGFELAFSSGSDPRPRRKDSWVSWNPLTDDGDASRLEAALLLDVRWFKNSVKINAEPKFIGWLVCEVESFREMASVDERLAAKRLAVVRAAAAIGKAMA